MFLVSLVVTAVSLIAKTRVIDRRWRSSKQDNEDCPIRKDRTTRQSLSRVEDLFDKS